MSNDFLFTSESVSEGHPDKVADQISDAILDAIFKQDPLSRVAAETLTNTGLVVLAGEITTNAHVDYIQVARDTIKRMARRWFDAGARRLHLVDLNASRCGHSWRQKSSSTPSRSRRI